MKTIIDKKTVKLYLLMIMVLPLLYQSCTCSQAYIPPKNGDEEFIIGGVFLTAGIDIPSTFYRTEYFYKLNNANVKEIIKEYDEYYLDMSLVENSTVYKCFKKNLPDDVILIIIADLTNEVIKGDYYALPVLKVKKILYVKKASNN